MNTMSIEARVKNLPQVMAYINEKLKESDCSVKTRMKIELAVEEVFVNVCHYAYGSGTGHVEIGLEFQEEPSLVKISFWDRGIPFDPLEKEAPNISLAPEERPIGGLGIFMTRKMMDDVQYEYKDGKNHLMLIKQF